MHSRKPEPRRDRSAGCSESPPRRDRRVSARRACGPRAGLSAADTRRSSSRSIWVLHTRRSSGRFRLDSLATTNQKRKGIMKIVVIGGTGLIGSKVVAKLQKSGVEAVAASPNSGVNTITGEGLAEALKGASVVV